MESAGKARNNGLYRHIRTSKEIIRNLLNDFVNTLISRKLDIKVFTNNKSLTNNFFSCSLFCCLNLAHFLYLFYIERVQFLRQNHIISESISRMFYCDSRFS